MFMKLAEMMPKPGMNLKRPHDGTVVDNNDPEKRGAIKVSIPELLEGSNDALPWILPVSPSFLGGSGNSSMFSVPEVGSKVRVIFPYEDINFGFYTGTVVTQQSHNSEWDEDYPNSYGFKDSKGNKFKVNKEQEFLEIEHSSGSKVKIDKDGTINITSTKDVKITATEKFQVRAKTMDLRGSGGGGDVDISAAGNINIHSDGITSCDHHEAGGSSDFGRWA